MNIEQLKQTIPKITEQLPDLKTKTAKEKAGPCPKCGGDDRFLSFTGKDRFLCRQCNWKGDHLDLFCHLNGKTIKELLTDFEQLFSEQLGELPAVAKDYLDGRALGIGIPFLVDNQLIGYSVEHAAITFPMMGPNGGVVGIQKIPVNGGKKKFWSGSDAKQGAFYIRNGKPYVITESVIDAISIKMVIDCSVVATFSSATVDKLKGLDIQDPVLFFDRDTAGQKATQKVLRFLPARVVNWDLAPDGMKDVNDLLKAGHHDLIHRMVADATAPNVEPEPSELADVMSIVDFRYEKERKKLAKELGVRVTYLDEQRKNARKEQECGSSSVVEDIHPWSVEVNGEELANEILSLLNGHVVLPDGSAEVITVWTILTYCYDQFRVLPILGIISPQKRCGKTTLLEVLNGLACRALMASSISTAAVYRTIDKYHPCLLVDEADSFLKDNEELRGVLNSGHTRASAFIIRCDGDDNEPKKFSTWAPKSIAAIGKLPGTLEDRAIMVSMRRKVRGENRKKIGRAFDAQAAVIRQKCQKWSDDINLRDHWDGVAIPDNDRAEDNWRPIATIARAVGGTWPDKIKRSVQLMMDVSGVPDDLSILLLEDIRELFATYGDKLSSNYIVKLLVNLEERPWEGLNRGRGISTNKLAGLLRPFQIHSKVFRVSLTEVRRGYQLEQFIDTFERYIPSSPGGGEIRCNSVTNE